MAYWKDTLKRMVAGYDSQISGLQSQVRQLQAKAQDLGEQADALTTVNIIQKVNNDEVLNIKKASFVDTLHGTCTIHFGSGYGVTNLTNWSIFYHGDVLVEGSNPGPFTINASNNSYKFIVNAVTYSGSIANGSYSASSLAATLKAAVPKLTFRVTGADKVNINCNTSLIISTTANSMYSTIGWSTGTYTPSSPRTVYQYGGRGWDGDSRLVCLVNEFDFIKDYINIDVNTGLYGINSMLSLINNGVDKLEDMIHKFEIAKRRLESFINSGISGCLINSGGGDL